MTITEKALADLLLRYFTTLEPVGRDVTLKNEMKKIAQPDGSTKVQMVPTKGDAYIPKDLSNAMSKAIAKAVWPELGTEVSPYNAPWFEWNGTDLSQFDPVVYGPNVNQPSSAVDVVDYAGLKWIRMKTAAYSTATTGNKGGMVLPISQTPPSADYVVMIDFLSTGPVGTFDAVGAGIAARFLDLEHGYICRYIAGSPASGTTSEDIARLNTSFTMTQLLQLADPSLSAAYTGMFMGMAVEGQLIRALIGEKAFASDATHTAAGKAGLFNTNSGIGAITVENYYRNVRCYTLDVLRHTIP